MTKQTAGLALRRWLGWLWRGADRDVRPGHIPQETWAATVLRDRQTHNREAGGRRRAALLRAIGPHRPPKNALPLLAGAALRRRERTA